MRKLLQKADWTAWIVYFLTFLCIAMVFYLSMKIGKEV